MYICYTLRDMKTQKIFLSLTVIALVSLLSYSVTSAYLTDKKFASGNTFSVGTLNLQVNDQTHANLEPFTIDALGTGSTGGTKTWKVKNVGSLPGQFSTSFDNLINRENGCNDAESQVDTTCDNPGPNQGELGKYIKAVFYFNDQKKVESLLTSTATSQISALWASPDSSVILNPGETATLRLDWQLLPSYGNDIQSDSLTFDVGFSLQQILK